MGCQGSTEVAATAPSPSFPVDGVSDISSQECGTPVGLSKKERAGFHYDSKARFNQELERRKTLVAERRHRRASHRKSIALSDAKALPMEEDLSPIGKGSDCDCGEGEGDTPPFPNPLLARTMSWDSDEEMEFLFAESYSNSSGDEDTSTEEEDEDFAANLAVFQERVINNNLSHFVTPQPIPSYVEENATPSNVPSCVFPAQYHPQDQSRHLPCTGSIVEVDSVTPAREEGMESAEPIPTKGQPTPRDTSIHFASLSTSPEMQGLVIPLPSASASCSNRDSISGDYHRPKICLDDGLLPSPPLSDERRDSKVPAVTTTTSNRCNACRTMPNSLNSSIHSSRSRQQSVAFTERSLNSKSSWWSCGDSSCPGGIVGLAAAERAFSHERFLAVLADSSLDPFEDEEGDL